MRFLIYGILAIALAATTWLVGWNAGFNLGYDGGIADVVLKSVDPNTYFSKEHIRERERRP